MECFGIFDKNKWMLHWLINSLSRIMNWLLCNNVYAVCSLLWLTQHPESDASNYLTVKHFSLLCCSLADVQAFSPDLPSISLFFFSCRPWSHWKSLITVFLQFSCSSSRVLLLINQYIFFYLFVCLFWVHENVKWPRQQMYLLPR